MHRDSWMMSSRLGTVGDGGRELKLFGVRISGEGEEEEVMRKSASMGNLVSCEAAAAAAEHGSDNGYLSDGGLIGGSRKRRGAHDRKRGIPWTEEEHKTFLAGLKKLGKGDWRGISRSFVATRTPTQVASHAQKYFLRQINPSKKKRRSSLFDVVIDETAIIPKTGQALSLKKTPEAAKEVNHPCQNDRSVANPTLNSIQTFIQGENASRAIPPKTNCINVLNSISFNLMQVGISGSKKDQIIPYPEQGKPPFHANHSAFVPDFLKLSLAIPRVLSESSVTSPSSTKNRGLELSIGLPWPQSLAELSSYGAAGAISVV